MNDTVRPEVRGALSAIENMFQLAESPIVHVSLRKTSSGRVACMSGRAIDNARRQVAKHWCQEAVGTPTV